jgi:GTPase SAR1 family protein
MSRSRDFNVMVIGPEAVGKTSILERYIHGNFSDEHKTHPFDVKFLSKTIKIADENKRLKFNFFDFSGQSTSNWFLKDLYKDKQAIILVTEKNKLNDSLEDYFDRIPPKVPVYLVVNKCEPAESKDLSELDVTLEEENQVRSFHTRLKQKFQNLSLEPMFCSAKTGANVFDIFEKIEKELELTPIPMSIHVSTSTANELLSPKQPKIPPPTPIERSVSLPTNTVVMAPTRSNDQMIARLILLSLVFIPAVLVASFSFGGIFAALTKMALLAIEMASCVVGSLCVFGALAVVVQNSRKPKEVIDRKVFDPAYQKAMAGVSQGGITTQLGKSTYSFQPTMVTCAGVDELPQGSSNSKNNADLRELDSESDSDNELVGGKRVWEKRSSRV